MKKLLSILAIAGVMTACNSGENKEGAADSTKMDSSVTTPAEVAPTPAPVDSAAHATDSAATGVSADSTKK
jgi:hypothetical protein